MTVKEVHINPYVYLEKKYKKRLLTAAEVADELSWTEEAVRNAISKNQFQIPTVKVGRNRRIEIERLAAYMDAISKKAEMEFKKSERMRSRT